MTMVLYMYVFILLKYIAYTAKGIKMNKMLKRMKNNVTALKELKNVYITTRESESAAEI